MPRLYLQRGLSDRVVRAVSQRRERFLAMASDGVDARNCSRSPVRAPDAETSGLDGTVNVPVLPGGSLPEGAIPIPDETPLAPGGTSDAPGLDVIPPSLDVIPTDPAEPEVWKDQLVKCLRKLESVSFELSAATDAYGDHHEK